MHKLFLSKPVNDVALFARVRSLARLKMMMDELRVRQATTGGDDLFEAEMAEDAQFNNARILLVEGSEFLGKKIAEHLEGADCQVDRATSGSEGLALGCRHRFDLIIAGLDIGGEDGLRLCSQFRSQEETRHVPILLVLDETDLAELAKGLDLGVTDYLIKPIDRNELLARARTQIRRRRYHDKLRGLLESSVSMAYTDPLTGVYNRRYMKAHLGSTTPMATPRATRCSRKWPAGSATICATSTWWRATAARSSWWSCRRRPWRPPRRSPSACASVSAPKDSPSPA